VITIYAIHVLAAAAWVGGLPPLLFALSEQRRSGPREARDCTLDICSGFSLMAMMAVTLLVLSGIANAGVSRDHSASFSVRLMAMCCSRK
jgi:copper resistance protein D